MKLSKAKLTIGLQILRKLSSSYLKMSNHLPSIDFETGIFECEDSN